MKNYTLKFSVSISDNSDSYSPTYQIQLDIKEKLPANVDAQTYVKRRLAEEVKRHFDALTEPLDNKTDEVKADVDPLTGDVPF